MLISSNSNSDQSDSTVNNKSLAVNIDHYPFEQTYDQNDLNGNYTGFLPVIVRATGVPNYTKFYADIDGQIFQQPIQYDGKYKFVLKNDGSGLMPQYIQDQNTNNYDLNIKIKPESNTATLTIDDTVLNIIRNNPLYHGILTLPDRDLNTVTLFNTNGKDYATALEIDLSNVTLPRLKNGTILDKRGEYDVVNNDGNNDDIEFEKVNTPTPQLLLRKKDPLLDDPMEDDTETILGSFIVDIPPPKINSPTTNNGFYKFNDNWNALTEGSSEDHDLIIQVPNTTETLTATQNNHTYTPTQGNVGFSSVTVEVPQPSVEPTQNITITENKTTTITPSSGFDSIGQLKIVTEVPSQVNNQNLATITENGTYTPDANYSGFNSFTVSVPQPSIQSNKQVTLTNNSTVTIRPDNNYDALDKITITTNVPTTDTTINNQNVNSNNVITSNGFYAPDNQHTGFNAFTVAIPLQRDKNINVNGKQGQTIVWTPDTGYAGFEKTTITVIPPALQTKTITRNGTYHPDDHYDGFSSVTVNVSSSTPNVYSIKIGGYYGETHLLSSFLSIDNLTESQFQPGTYLIIWDSYYENSPVYYIQTEKANNFYEIKKGFGWCCKLASDISDYTYELFDSNQHLILLSHETEWSDLTISETYFDLSNLPARSPVGEHITTNKMTIIEDNGSRPLPTGFKVNLSSFTLGAGPMFIPESYGTYIMIQQEDYIEPYSWLFQLIQYDDDPIQLENPGTYWYYRVNQDTSDNHSYILEFIEGAKEKSVSVNINRPPLLIEKNLLTLNGLPDEPN